MILRFVKLVILIPVAVALVVRRPEPELALDHREHVRRDAGVERRDGGAARDVALHPLAHRFDQLGRCRHVVRPAHQRPSSARNRSCSVSHTRRPIAASS